MRILPSSTYSMGTGKVNGRSFLLAYPCWLTGLARTDCATPAPIPARAVCGSDSSPNGEMARLHVPYAANSSELTAAIPMSGLAMPANRIPDVSLWPEG